MIIENTYEFIKTGYGEKAQLEGEKLISRLEKLKEDCASEIDEFIEAYKSNDRGEMIDACVDLLTFATNLPIHGGISELELSTYAIAVHQSNMTKFCDSYEEALQTKEAYANGTHPNKLGEKIEVEIAETGNNNKPYMVRMPNGGKIMKSIKFVDTKDFLDEQFV